MFLPEFDRDYLNEKGFVFREVTENQKGLIIQDWNLPKGKFNHEKADLLILLPPGYPDTPPDMFYFFPPILLMPLNRPARATESIQTFEGKNWQRWSRHFDASQWRSGIDGIHTYLKRIEEAVKIAG